MSCVIERWRTALSVLCVGGVLIGCSARGTSILDERAELFAELPRTCVEISSTVSGGLQLLGGSLPESSIGLVGDDRTSGVTGQEMRCRQTADEPVPRPVSTPTGQAVPMPTTGPMRRSAVIDLWLSPSPRRAGQTTEPLAVPGHSSMATAVGVPTRLAGVGQDSIAWLELDREGRVSAHTRVRIDNLTITVKASGADWSDSFPSYDAPDLRSDLRAGADAIASTLAAALPAELPRATIGVFESLEVSSATSTRSTPENEIAVWDPCELAGPVAEAAGLPANPMTNDQPTPDRCYWRTDWGSIQVDSVSGVFEYGIYDDARYTELRLVSFGDRTAVQAQWETLSPYFCELAFDTPFGAVADQVVGYVTVQIAVHDSTSPRQACDRLTPIGASLAAHLPPSR